MATKLRLGDQASNTSPLAIVPTTKGPPHIGAAGWLFYIDASNLLLTRLVPGKLEVRANAEPSSGRPTRSRRASWSAPTTAVSRSFAVCATRSVP